MIDAFVNYIDLNYNFTTYLATKLVLVPVG